MSPGRGLVFEGMVDFLFQRVVLALDLEVDFRHLAAAFDDGSGMLFPFFVLQPVPQQPAPRARFPAVVACSNSTTVSGGSVYVRLTSVMILAP